MDLIDRAICPANDDRRARRQAEAKGCVNRSVEALVGVLDPTDQIRREVGHGADEEDRRNGPGGAA
jgi:hypothetical protein